MSTQRTDRMSRRAQPAMPHTGWPPGLLQDDSRALSRWFANKPDARRRVREACAEIARLQSARTPQPPL